MPLPLSPENWRAVKLLTDQLQAELAQPDALGSARRALGSLATGDVQPPSRRDYERLEQLVGNARWQTRAVCDGMAKLVSDVGRQTDIVPLLRGTISIGRMFGRLPSEPMPTDLASLHNVQPATLTNQSAAIAMQQNPADWFAISANGTSLEFIDSAHQALHQAFSKNAGCPVLPMMVNARDEQINVYDLYWSVFVDDYLRDNGFMEPNPSS